MISREPLWQGRYFRLAEFFRLRFGQRVYKIPLDAGFYCPNRDGTKGLGGCTFCFVPSFSPQHCRRDGLGDLHTQIRRGKKRDGKALYIAYFQAYTNTYAPLEKLRLLYDQALADEEVIGLSIATRPDCLNPAIVELLCGYARKYHVWLELGLQSAHDSTLARINRGHNRATFDDAMAMLKGREVHTCVHLILGLPGEDRNMMFQTLVYLNSLQPHGVKFHHLQVMQNTPLSREYAAGEVSLFERFSDYLPLVCDCLEHLDPDIVVQRLAGQAASQSLLIAPRWPESSGEIAAAVEKELQRRDTRQGCRFEAGPRS